MALRLSWDPLAIASGEADDVAEAATWGLFRMSVDVGGSTRLLTRREDIAGRTLADGVYGPTVAIAEWLARTWGHIALGRRPFPQDGSRTQQYAWRRAHVISYAGDGLALPPVEFSREDSDSIRVVCRAELRAPLHARVRFIEQCAVSLPAVEATEAIRSFVEDVLARLRGSCPESARSRDLEALWAVATDPANPLHALYERTCRAGALWGAADAAEMTAVERLPRREEHPLLDAVLERIPSGELAGWTRWAKLHWNKAAELEPIRAGSAFARLRGALAGAPASAADHAWQSGWHDARRLREAIGSVGLRVDKPPGLEGAVRDWDPEVDGRLGERDSVLAWHSGHRPLHLTGTKRTPFLMVRDVHAPLFGPQTDAAFVHSPLIVGSSSVANAFAAEWLAPVDDVRAHVGDRTRLDLDDVMEIAKEMGAPPDCVRHQVENHGLAVIVSGA